MSIAELLELSRAEKLKIVEALWENLSAEPEGLQSPQWHRAELEKTARAHKAGEVEVLDWEEIKKKLKTL